MLAFELLLYLHRLNNAWVNETTLHFYLKCDGKYLKSDVILRTRSPYKSSSIYLLAASAVAEWWMASVAQSDRDAGVTRTHREANEGVATMCRAAKSDAFLANPHGPSFP